MHLTRGAIIGSDHCSGHVMHRVKDGNRRYFGKSTDVLVVGARRRQRDRRGRWRVGPSAVVLGHPLFERLDALRNVAHQSRNLAATKQQSDNANYDNPMKGTKRTQFISSYMVC
jgi:hypothetical protein